MHLTTETLTTHLPTVLAIASEKEKTTGEIVTGQMLGILAPLALLAVGLASMVFLFRREMTNFLMFAALAVGIGAIFFHPEIIVNLATTFSHAMS